MRDRLEMRRAFFCIFRAFPASSPSIPNRLPRILWRLFFFSCSPVGSRSAWRGVILESFRAGAQAEQSTVSTADMAVTSSTAGWYWKTASCLPGKSAANLLTASRIPAQPAVPSRIPASTGSAQRAAASCTRHSRICPGVAPMLEKMPNWRTLACMEISKAVRITRTRDTHRTSSTAAKKGRSRGGSLSRGSVIKYLDRSVSCQDTSAISIPSFPQIRAVSLYTSPISSKRSSTTVLSSESPSFISARSTPENPRISSRSSRSKDPSMRTCQSPSSKRILSTS